MGTEVLSIENPVSPETSWAVPTDAGLTVARIPTYTEWFAVGIDLARLYHSMAWVIGDYLNWGETWFGEKCSQVYTLFERGDVGRAKQTLANWKSVAKAIPPTERHAGLSFSHHAEVACVPEPEQREALLTEAEEQGYSVSALRAKVSEKKGENLFVKYCRQALHFLESAEEVAETREQAEAVRLAMDGISDALANFTVNSK